MVAARLRTARNDLFAAGGGPFRRRSHPHFVRGGLPAARRGAPGAHLHPLRRPQGLRLARRNVRHGQRRQMPASQSRGCRQRSADGRPLGFRNRPPRYGRHSRKCRTSLHQSELQGDATQLQPPRTTDRTPADRLPARQHPARQIGRSGRLPAFVHQPAGRQDTGHPHAGPCRKDGPRGGNRSPETHPHIRAHPLLLLLGADRGKARTANAPAAA